MMSKKYLETKFTNSEVLTRLLTHPHSRLPDCLINSLYGRMAKGSFDGTYIAARESLELDELPEQPVYGLELVEAVSRVFVDDSSGTIAEALDKRDGLIAQQNESLVERIETMELAFHRLEGPDYGMRGALLEYCFREAKAGRLVDNIYFQRAIFKVGFCKKAEYVSSLVADLRNRIEHVV